LEPHPQNWRTHPDGQRSALRAAVDAIGFADVVIARELPNKKLQILDGHLRSDEFADEKLPVLVLDLDEDEARIFLASLDPLAGMAETDAEQLEQLLSEIETDDEELQKLLDKLAEDAKIPGADIDPPDDFPEVDEDIEVEHECPKCGYKWSGGK